MNHVGFFDEQSLKNRV